MARRPHAAAARAGRLLPALLACLAAACAQVEPPRGGPEDRTPPVLLSVRPDSGAVGLRGVDRLEFTFSEKVDPRPAQRFLKLYPPLEIAKTKWHGRRRAEVLLRDTLPPDAVVVVEVPRGLPDAHRVASDRTRRYPLATADSLPPGRLAAKVVYHDAAARDAVLELYPLEPDSLPWNRRELARRAEADTAGRIEVPWLAAPGGPWVARLFLDENHDLRPGENEAQRLLPGTVATTAAAPLADLGTIRLFAPRDPGSLRGYYADADTARDLFGWAAKVAEQDTGFAPVHAGGAAPARTRVAPGDTTVWEPAGPGAVRVVLFADLDGDSLLSALPDSTALADSVIWTWEPFVVADSLTVEPGLPLPVALPAVPAAGIPCPVAPPPRPAAAAAPDSLAAAADSLAVAPADTTATAPAPEEREEP